MKEFIDALINSVRKEINIINRNYRKILVMLFLIVFCKKTGNLLFGGLIVVMYTEELSKN